MVIKSDFEDGAVSGYSEAEISDDGILRDAHGNEIPHSQTRLALREFISNVIMAFTNESGRMRGAYASVDVGYDPDAPPDYFCFCIAPCEDADLEEHMEWLRTLSEEQRFETKPPLDIDIVDGIDRFIDAVNQQQSNGSIEAYADEDGFFYIEADDAEMLSNVLHRALESINVATMDLRVLAPSPLLSDAKERGEYVASAVGDFNRRGLNEEKILANELLLQALPIDVYPNLDNAMVQAALQLKAALGDDQSLPPVIGVSTNTVIATIRHDLGKHDTVPNFGLYRKH
jgi:hypothetical protein